MSVSVVDSSDKTNVYSLIVDSNDPIYADTTRPGQFTGFTTVKKIHTNNKA